MMIFQRFVVGVVLFLAFFAAPHAGAVVYDDVITKRPVPKPVSG
jgi:hypothetical protein